METQILEFSMCIIESLAVYIFFGKLFTPRQNSKYFFVPTVIVYTLVLHFFPSLNIIKSVVSILCNFLGGVILYKEKIYIKSAFSLVSVYNFYIVDVIIANILSLFSDKQIIEIFYGDFTFRIIICLFTKLINIFILIVLYRVFKNVILNTDKKMWILFNIVIAAFLAVTIGFITFYQYMQPDNGSAVTYSIVSILFFVMSMIVIYFFTYICSSFETKKKLYLLQSGYNAIEEKLLFQSENSEKLKKIRHDMKNHLISIKVLLEDDKINESEKLLSEVIGETDKINIGISQTTGNSIIDAIVSYKSMVCANKGIKFEYSLSLLPELSIDAIDISSVMSNLIDNAIEAAEKTPEPYIQLKIFMYGKYLTLYVRNSYLGKESVETVQGRLLTTKDDAAQHGYGMQIIEALSQKYDGECDWKTESGIFKINVIMKNN